MAISDLSSRDSLPTARATGKAFRTWPPIFMQLRFLDSFRKATLKISLGISMVALVTLFVPECSAATYYVSPSGDNNNSGTDQAAPLKTIDVAVNNAISGDTIILEDGTYSDAGDVNVDTGGRTLTITSANGPNKTIIDCSKSAVAFTLHQSEGTGGTPAIIENLTIKNGAASAGGAVSVSGADLEITNCTFSNNVVTGGIFGGGGFGGAIYNTSSSSITISGCTFSSNIGVSGGAIYNDAGITVKNCSFSNDQAGKGGSIYNSGNLTIDGSTFSNETGNAVVSSAASCTVTGCTFTNNPNGAIVMSSGPFGGGSGLLTATGSTFTGNTGNGAITSIATMISNCSFTNNSSTNHGGALSISYDGQYVSSIIACTFRGNTASSSGGAIYNTGNGGGQITNSLTMANCIFLGNSVTGGSGGAVYDYGGATIQFCTFYGNTASENGGAVEDVSASTVLTRIMRV